MKKDIDIKEIEEGVLIEANDFNMGIHQLVNDILVKNRSMSKKEVLDIAGDVISSLTGKGFIKVIITKYREESEYLYTPVSHEELSEKELENLLKSTDKWDEMGVFSKIDRYELCITDKGSEYLF